jgi:hypothetical protein
MTDERPADLQAAAELRQMLRDLGGASAQPRDASQESALEAKMAALIDAEVESLVTARRMRRRVAFGFVAAAALVALTLGLRGAQTRSGALAISAEPTSISTSKVGQPPRPPEPPSVRSSAPVVAPVTPARPSTPSAVVAPAPLASVEPQSTLAEENQLFKEAAEADRRGDVDGAISRLDRLLVVHPASPLAQTAMVRKFRLLAKNGRADDARREAERYLAAYPTGFAVGEAQALKDSNVAPSAP